MNLFGEILAKFLCTTADMPEIVEISAPDEMACFEAMQKIGFPSFEAGGRYYRKLNNELLYDENGKLKEIISTSEYKERYAKET